MKDIFYKACKNCGGIKFITWEQLTDDDKFVINKSENIAEFSTKQLKRQHFCKRCLYVLTDFDSAIT